jgi:hypothetical protein
MRAKTRHPHTNGICEPFHKTMRKWVLSRGVSEKDYRMLGVLLLDLGAWIKKYNE